MKKATRVFCLLIVLSNLLHAQRQVVKGEEMFLTALPYTYILPMGESFLTELSVGIVPEQVDALFSSPDGEIIQRDGKTYLLVKGEHGPFPDWMNTREKQAVVYAKIPTGKRDTFKLEFRQKLLFQRPGVSFHHLAGLYVYKGCANEMEVDIPLYSLYPEPKLVVPGASATPITDGRDQFRIVPVRDSGSIAIHHRTTEASTRIKTIPFHSLNPPKPVLEVRIDSSLTNGMNYLRSGQEISFRLVPDAVFSSLYPHDCRYEVRGIDLYAHSPGDSVRLVNRLPGVRDATQFHVVPLENTLGKLPAGTICWVRLRSVYRVNYAGKLVSVPLTDLERTVSFMWEP